MQLLTITKNTTLLGLSKLVGSRNVDSVLNANSLTRCPNIGKAFLNAASAVMQDASIDVSAQRKSTLLNTLTGDSDVFESTALLSTPGWRLMSSAGTLPNMLRIPETVVLPDSTNILGNGEPVKRSVYDKVMEQLHTSGRIDPGVFNEYSSRRGSQIVDTAESDTTLQWFNLPWGQITLYSSIRGTSVEFPVYPSGLEDGRSATYETMPDMIYQYEPWQIYKSSGPRTNTYEFNIHRDMWSGDHRDGKCNELIRFCEANCYPEFKGAAVNTALVTLYIAGTAHITGILTDVKTTWDEDSPIGLDGFYLHCKLQLTITEVSTTPLNYQRILEKGLVG